MTQTLPDADEDLALPDEDDPYAAYAEDDEDDSDRFERFHDSRRKIREAQKRAAATELLVEETGGLEGGFRITYTPSRHEAGWLLSSLRPFYEQGLISDVLYAVKGGKEASVYCCQARPETGHTLLAAKVYRPREFRSLRNDKVYREGRPVLGATGRPIKDSDKRAMRALGAGTDIGKQMEHTSWLMYEFTTLERLQAAGAAVPVPVAAAENALLMGYAGDATQAAPTLHETSVEPDEAVVLFEEALRNITVMLAEGFIHGDLSAYNILYWDGEITLIDFPQVVPVESNPHAEAILERDVTRVCEYFARHGVEEARTPRRILSEIHRRAARYVAAAHPLA